LKKPRSTAAQAIQCTEFAGTQPNTSGSAAARIAGRASVAVAAAPRRTRRVNLIVFILIPPAPKFSGVESSPPAMLRLNF
jgi:hypothetical protein